MGRAESELQWSFSVLRLIQRREYQIPAIFLSFRNSVGKFAGLASRCDHQRVDSFSLTQSRMLGLQDSSHPTRNGPNQLWH